MFMLFFFPDIAFGQIVITYLARLSDVGTYITFSNSNSKRSMWCKFGVSRAGQVTKHTPPCITSPRINSQTIIHVKHYITSPKFRRVTIRGAQPSARLSEEICLSKGSAGVSERGLRGVSQGSTGSLRGSAAGFSEVFRG